MQRWNKFLENGKGLPPSKTAGTKDRARHSVRVVGVKQYAWRAADKMAMIFMVVWNDHYIASLRSYLFIKKPLELSRF
jgi:hypothetical protein